MSIWTDPVDTAPFVAVRRVLIEGTCEVHQGHRHDYDHWTVVITGRIAVSQDGALHSQEYAPGDWVFIAKGSFHEIKALAPMTRYQCVYLHRDARGMVVEDYVGNARESQAIQEKLPSGVASPWA